jgi:hypothetical protein
MATAHQLSLPEAVIHQRNSPLVESVALPVMIIYESRVGG